MDRSDTAIEFELDRLFDSFQPFEASQLYVEDTVLDATRRHRSIGDIDRTHEDVDSHAPQPESDYPGTRIQRGRGVSVPVFQRFLRDGVPPKNTVLVRWQGPVPVELTLVSNVRLIDRALLTGDVVKRNAQSTLSGTVTDVRVTCAAIHSMHHTLPLNGIGIPSSHVIRNIPAEELDLPELYVDGRIIIHNDWVGRIDYVERDITIRLSNGTVVTVEDPSDLEIAGGNDGIAVGKFVRTKKGNLRRGRWIFGAFDPNTDPVGQIFQARPTSIEVTWLAQRPGTNQEQPRAILDADVLDSNTIQGYDHMKCDADSAAFGSPDYSPGDFVRFRDIADATLRYGSDGGTVKVDRTSTLGFDLNTFYILATRTRVTVQWQDGYSTTEPSTSLVPDLNIDDDDEVWPGEIVLSREAKAGDSEDWSFVPARVGVVQSVNSADRIAQVRWWQHSSVQYYKDTDNAEGTPDEPGLVPDPSLNDLALSPEEVSLYDVRPAIGLNKRLGEFVIVLPESEITSRREEQSGQDIDWFGEVMQLGTDGMITVRLGLAEKVRNIKVRPEHLLLVYGSHMDNDFNDPIDLDEDELAEMEDEDFLDGYTQPYEISMGDDSSSELSTEFYETMEYQGNGGERIEGDGGDDAWSTESESDDVGNADTPMTDIKSSPNGTPPKDRSQKSHLPRREPPPTSVEIVPKESSPLGIAGQSNTPPGFAILERSVPTSHHYYATQQPTSTTNIRRITKEHKILQKDGAIPEGVFVRTWESRLDLLRILFIGPLDTPYMFAPFIMDIHLAEDFPRKPPQVFFHSWTNGTGPVNPNLYEDGKVCLSLLGTWSGEPTESWDPEKSTVLQILVSLLGLVLVKEPYYNEAGYEVRIGSEDAKIPSALYSERTYLRSRAFVVHAINHPVEGFEDDIRWLYLADDNGAPRLLKRTIDAAEQVISASRSGDAKQLDKDGFNVISAGAVVKLKRQLLDLEACVPVGRS